MDMEHVSILTHPLIKHKITMLRDKNTGTNEFRKLIEEIATLMGYEALRDLPLMDVEVTTPLETCMSPMIAGRKLAIVPILRAGLLFEEAWGGGQARGLAEGRLSAAPFLPRSHVSRPA